MQDKYVIHAFTAPNSALKRFFSYFWNFCTKTNILHDFSEKTLFQVSAFNEELISLVQNPLQSRFGTALFNSYRTRPILVLYILGLIPTHDWLSLGSC